MYVCTDERCAQSRDVLLWASNLVRPLLTVFAHVESWEGQTLAGRVGYFFSFKGSRGGCQWILNVLELRNILENRIDKVDRRSLRIS
jgi:hypothetical protein